MSMKHIWKWNKFLGRVIIKNHMKAKKNSPPEKEKFVISFVCRYCYPSKVRGRFNPQIFLWINYVFTKGLLHSPCKGSTIIFAKILNRELFCFETERFKGSFYQTLTATEEPVTGFALCEIKGIKPRTSFGCGGLEIEVDCTILNNFSVARGHFGCWYIWVDKINIMKLVPYLMSHTAKLVAVQWLPSKASFLCASD